MKKILLSWLIFFPFIIYSQVPNQINYQGIARNSVGNVLPNKNISVRLSVHDGTANGAIVYSETRNVTTSSFGLFNIAIGSPGTTTLSGTVAGINWASGAKFLQVEIDPGGGSNFLDLGAAQLLSVPYALFSGSSSNGLPTGPAGGDLSGTYPNPSIATNAVTANKLANNSVTTTKIADASVTLAKIAPGVIPTSLSPSGAAGGDLSGAYPNPTVANGVINTLKLADNSVTTSKIVDASVTLSKIAPGVIPTSLSPSGAAGGDLSGTYPNPTVANGVINTLKLADNSVTTSKIVDASVTLAKIAPGVIPTSLSPSGAAGGDLSGTYPNPTVANGVINTSKLANNSVTTIKLADNAVTTTKIADASVTLAKIAPGVIPTSLSPSGAAGGDLSGTYPNPTVADGVIGTSKLADNSVTNIKLGDDAVTTTKIVDASVTLAKIAPGVIPTSLSPSGAAGGDLSGTYPNPTVADGVIGTSKLADNSVTTAKILDASVTLAKIAPGVIPTSLSPSGAAGGDLSGTYPNPAVTKLQGVLVNNLAPTTGQVLKFDGTQWSPGTDDIGTSGGSTPTGPAGGDLSGTYPNPNIASNAITNAKIANGAVITPKIGNSAVTYAKIQNVTANRLLGNPNGVAGAPSEISLGAGLSFSGTTLNISGGTLSGGTANYIPKWTSATTLSSSLLYDDGTNIGIGTTVPTKTFSVAEKFQVDVNGNIVKINNVPTSFPVSNASGVLTNDGSGNLSWTPTSGSGTVTSVGLSLPGFITVSGSPVTASGTLTGTLASQTANTFFAAPDGIAGTPTFRQLAVSDLPNLSGTYVDLTSNQTVAGIKTWSSAANFNGGLTSGSSSQFQVNSAGNIVKINNAPTSFPASNASGVLTNDGSGNLSWSAAGGSGTVTSVGLSLPGFITVSGSPVTASGTLTGTLASQSANTVFAAPNGAAGSPTFRSLAASDIPNLDAGKITTGILPIARGGTGSGAAPANGQLLIGNGTGYSLATLTQGSGISITNSVGSITIAATGGLSGGTANFISKWTSPSALSSSLLYDDGTNVGIGTTAPTKTFSVAEKFQVDANGNIVRINNAPTSFPASNASGVLTNDGSGNLSWSPAGGIGTVTSVGLSLPGFITVSGSPVTASGTLTGTLASQTANTFFAAPNGAAGSPTFRQLVVSDLPNLSGTYVDLTSNQTVAGIKTWSSAANFNSGLSSGSSSQFQVNSSGNIVKINNAPTSFPASNASGVLTNDGSGNLSWSPVSGSGTVTNIATGAGLTGGPITTSGTISIANGGVTNAMLVNSSITINPGTGLSGGGSTALGGSATLNLANTTVTAGSFGSATQVPQFTVDAQGRLTAASNITISGVAPGGNAGGDLSGTYPNPVVSKLQGIGVSNTVPASGQVLKYNGTQWIAANESGGGLTLPFSSTMSSASSLFVLTNSGTGDAIEGINSSTNANAIGITGKITSLSAGSSSVAVRGIHSGNGANGIGVWGSHDGFGKGVYGTSVNGNGVEGFSSNGPGIFGSSDTYAGGFFDNENGANTSDALFANTVGSGSGVSASSDNGNGIWGTTYSPSFAGVFGVNFGGGEAIVGENSGTNAGAVVGKNSGTGGIGVHAIANSGSGDGGTGLLVELESGTGNLAVFKTGPLNMARIDDTGHGFFNGGTTNSGADVAEYFDVENSRNSYEPGDVLVISQNSDRKVEKSSSPYSTLVAGVFATKPGVLLTEKNAEQNQLNNMVPMGIIGVIPTKVCLEGGAIKRGDLLVTSSIPGVAMKADPEKVRLGQVIGKALQEYSVENIGKINVLVSIK